MANRPRRSKPGARPETTIDLEAGRIAKAGGAEDGTQTGSLPEAEQDETVSMNDTTKPGEAAQTPGSQTPDAKTPSAKTPVAATDGAKTPETTVSAAATPEERHEDALISATVDDAAERERKNEIATGIASADALAGGEPVSTSTPSAPLGTTDGGETPADPLLSDAARSDEATLGETGETTAKDGTEAGPTEAFARDEGFAGKRRDLGEFEDDETVLPAAHPEPAGPDPLTSSPYHAAAGTSPTDHRPGFGPLLGAGLLGAVIALGGGAALLYSGAVRPPAAQTPAVSTTQFAPAGEVQKLTGDIATLRGTVEQLQSAQAAGGAGTGNVSRTEFTQLTDRVTANERYAQANGDSAAAAAKADEAATAARDTASEALNTANAARDTAQSAQQTAQSAQQAAQSAQQAATSAQTAANETRDTVNSLGQRVDAIEESNRRAATALSAAGLKSAIDSGQPFMQELERFAQASGNNGDAVNSLRDFAASGVPTISALDREWNEAETRILTSLRPVDSTADVGTQVLSGLRSLVTVRPAGSSVSPETQGPEATVARMDEALDKGDFAAWLKEWDTLPDAAKSASKDFADKVRARANADDLIRQTINSAVGASASQG
ncbi:hypothetical protein [Aureimonas ureilytica]|uniref:hypothetical protein n=1 Tax=Aureimonas ureilytica TaxID=401562 RepID=UPI000373F7B4|nr:hypothetical protein [Aureimonas ureilytica]